MRAAIKAEFRKLLTVRTTYCISLVVLVLLALIAFYGQGWHLPTSALNQPTQLANDITNSLSLTIFGAIVAILLMTHEYRYNTIMYTLSSSNSRSKILVAKILAVSCYALVLTLFVAVLSPVMSYLGIHAHGHTLVHQNIPYKELIWQSAFYGWSMGLAGLLLAILIRSQVGSLVALFIIPTIGEHLLGLLLSTKAVYLPFTAQGYVIGNQGVANVSISPAKGALVFSIYLVVGYIVAWVLFLRRDAN